VTVGRTAVAAAASAAVIALGGCRSSSEPARPSAHATASPTPLERSAPAASRVPRTRESPIAPLAAPSSAGTGAGMSKREARQIVERVMRERVGRDLSAPDYDRLADAVIRLRTASRALASSDLATADQAAERQAMQSALSDIVTITGLQPSELSGAFASDDAPAR
jgi:hypothetical protein